jgi:hypothetical protein
MNVYIIWIANHTWRTTPKEVVNLARLTFLHGQRCNLTITNDVADTPKHAALHGCALLPKGIYNANA